MLLDERVPEPLTTPVEPEEPPLREPPNPVRGLELSVPCRTPELPLEPLLPLLPKPPEEREPPKPPEEAVVPELLPPPRVIVPWFCVPVMPRCAMPPWP